MTKKKIFFYVLTVIHGLHVMASDTKSSQIIPINEFAFKKLVDNLFQDYRISGTDFILASNYKKIIIKHINQSIFQNKKCNNETIEAMIITDIHALRKKYAPKKDEIVITRNVQPQVKITFRSTTWGTAKLPELDINGMK